MTEMVVDAASRDRSSSGNITCRICIRNQDGTFPDEEWPDSPVVIPFWWIKGLRELPSGRTFSFEGEFMVGDFSFVVESGVISWKEGELEMPAGIVDIQSMPIVYFCRKNCSNGL